MDTIKVKFKENIHIFKCPVCKEGMHLDDFKSLVCLNRHCFDISKRGYVNLLLNSGKSHYDKEMFESRNIICKAGFFDPLIGSVVSLIYQRISSINSNNIKVLDAGCGEGFHLSRVMSDLHKKISVNLQGIGIDISKEGIQIASKNYKDIIWCVADLAKIPFKDKQFEVVLNILSPSNYREFDRIICDEGILLKVVAGSSYLKELREVLYQETDRETYSSDRVIEHFGRNFKIIDIQRVLYNFAVKDEKLKHLIKMTPLSWRATNEKLQNVFNNGIDCVTVDFNIIIGNKRL
jgi:23S rRNA (guanine745-N1)-methyltransferase